MSNYRPQKSVDEILEYILGNEEENKKTNSKKKKTAKKDKKKTSTNNTNTLVTNLTQFQQPSIKSVFKEDIEDDQEIEEFKKKLISESVYAHEIQKIKPFLSKNWIEELRAL